MRVGHMLLASIVVTFSGRWTRYSRGITRETLDITAGIATSVSQVRILRLANAVARWKR